MDNLVKILEWVYLFAAKRVSLPVYQQALQQQSTELQKALSQFQAIEIEPEDRALWDDELRSALEGLFDALGRALKEAEQYTRPPQESQIKHMLLHLQEVERIEQYLQSRLGCASYLTQKEVQGLLSVASEKVETLLSME